MTTPAEQTPAATPELPSSAFPPGVDPATYLAQHQNVNTDPPPVSDPVGTAKAPAQRPEGVPEKFWDAEKGEVRTDALLKSYTELEKNRPTPTEPVETPAQASTDPSKTTLERPADPPAAPENAPAVDPQVAEVSTAIKSVSAKYAKEGKLGDEDFAALEKVGLPRQFVENYMRGVQAVEAAQTAAVHKAAGGAEAFEAARQWAIRDLSDADLAFYNENVTNPQRAASAAEWLMGKYRAANPSEGKLVTGGAQTGDVADVFRSPQQLSAAMNDPKYRTDPAYRDQVAAKLARSRAAGTLETNTSYYGAR